MTRLISAAAAALAVAACGNGSLSLDSLPEEFEDRICQKQVDCGAYPDVETCKAAIETLEVEQLQQSVDDGRANYDEGQAEECLAAFEDLISCESFTSVGSFGSAEDACADVFTGNVELGGECYDDEECAGNAVCEQNCGSDECCAGTCVEGETEPEPAEIGEDCSQADCVSGAWCKADDVAGTQTCEALGGEGDACQGFSGCQEGLACDGIFGEGMCVRPAAEGETCDPQDGFLACARDDNWCDPNDTTCKKRPVPGESCSVEVDNCISYAYCDGGTCAQLGEEGDSCDAELGPDCLGDLDCVNGTCEFEDPDPVCGPEA